jgi:uncharacterized protein (TIGR02996 family)
VRIGTLSTPAPMVRLNGETVDTDFVHVLHVGDEVFVLGHTLMFELVEGTPDDVRRFTGETPRVLDTTELDLLAALRADPADAVAHEVYADWLDEQGRGGEAEFVRLQWLPRGRAKLDPEDFSSEWMSHDPRAVQLRLRDLSPLMEPFRRALVSQPAVLCRRPKCTARWVQLRLDEASDLVRWCAECHGGVELCSTFDDVQERSRRRLPIAVDPGLVAERARLAFEFPDRDFDEPTQPRLVFAVEDDFGDEVT